MSAWLAATTMFGFMVLSWAAFFTGYENVAWFFFAWACWYTYIVGENAKRN